MKAVINGKDAALTGKLRFSYVLGATMDNKNPRGRNIGGFNAERRIPNY
jgi:hypothetical protein